jgi:hypothetical protein
MAFYDLSLIDHLGFATPRRIREITPFPATHIPSSLNASTAETEISRDGLE